MSDSDRTVAQYAEAIRPCQSSHINAFWRLAVVRSGSGASSATLPLLTQPPLRCIDRLNPQLTSVCANGMLVDAFYENVSKAKMEGTLFDSHERDEDVVLEFRPDNSQLMHVACLWSRCSAPGETDLLSFAAITDEPPPEVAAAGHDRCIVPIKPDNINAWLNPDASDLAAMYAILDDRDRPYFEHKLAA